ncbi:MAG: hypothetical protein WC340_06270 [Kiritimatiellia bacterium]
MPPVDDDVRRCWSAIGNMLKIVNQHRRTSSSTNAAHRAATTPNGKACKLACGETRSAMPLIERLLHRTATLANGSHFKVQRMCSSRSMSDTEQQLLQTARNPPYAAL